MKKISRLIAGAGIVIIIIAGLSIAATPTAARRYFLHSTSTLSMSPEESDLGIIKPGESVPINISIIYQYTKFAHPEGFFLLSAKPTKINITVKSAPSWCRVKLDKTVMEVAIPATTFLKGGNATVTVSGTVEVLEDAPGYEKGSIDLKAMAAENGNIKPSEASCKISLKTDYVAGVEATMDKSWLYLKPGENGTVDIYVTNRGNMPIVVKLTSEPIVSDNFSVVFPQGEVEIAVNETKTLQISIVAENSDEYVNEQVDIPMTVTYHAKGHSELEGTPKDLSLTLLVKSSKKPVQIDPLLIALIAGIVIVVIVAVAVHIKRRR